MGITYQDLFPGKCKGKWQTISIPQHAESEVFFFIRDSQGNPLDLTSPDLIVSGYPDPEGCTSHSGSISYSSCSPFKSWSSWYVSSSSSYRRSEVLVTEPIIKFHPSRCMQVKFAAYNQLGLPPIFDILGEIVDEQHGHLKFKMSQEITFYGGLFWGNIGVFQNQRLLRFNSVLVEIVTNVWGALAFEEQRSPRYDYPITMAEVRMALRDNCPTQNLLLEDFEFEDNEIMWAITRPVQLWNETRPPVNVYAVASFPFRYHHLQGACGELLLMAAHRLQRNKMAYNAGGLTIDDQPDPTIYYTKGMELKKEYINWMMNEKIGQNIEGGFGTLHSPYAY